MSMILSVKSELLKTKRSKSWLLTLIMAAFVPIFVLLVFKEVQDGEPSDMIKKMAKDAWNEYFYQARGMISIVFLPMFIILISTLLPQIEYRNNTWKQVMAAPHSYGRVYFSKFIILQLFIIGFLVAHNLLIGISANISSILNPKFNFEGNDLNWPLQFNNMLKTYVAILSLSAFQFWLSIRFKSFLIPMGIGILFCILGMMNMFVYKLIDPDMFFFNYAGFIFFKENAAQIPYTLWASVGYLMVFLGLGFLDFSRVKER